MKTSPKTFSGTPVGEEYAWNRDGSIIKISDRLAVMKVNADLDELILVTDPESGDFRWTVLDKAEILRWNQETDRLILTVSENGEEKDRIYLHGRSRSGGNPVIRNHKNPARKPFFRRHPGRGFYTAVQEYAINCCLLPNP